MGRIAILIGTILLTVGVPRLVAEPIADWSKNPDWHFVERKSLAKFLGGDQPVSADLILKKSAVMDQTLTIEADARSIVLQSGNSPHVVFEMPANSAGTTSTIVMSGGDDPKLFFNGKEQVRDEGRWFKVYSNPSNELTLHLEMTNFANVTFEPPAHAVPEPAPAKAVKVEAPPAGELIHTITPRQLTVAGTAFDESVHKTCTKCGGTGTVTVQVQTGTRQNGAFTFPVYTPQQQRCSACNGSGIQRSKNEVIINLSAKLVKALQGLNKGDPKAPDVMTSTYDKITKDIIADQKTWTLLTQYGRSILAEKSPPMDSTVISVVEVKESIPNGDQRRYRVRVVGTDRQVYVDDPVLADELKSGRALMGGLVAKPIDGPEGQKMTVLHGGFLIAPPIEHEWYWWNQKD